MCCVSLMLLSIIVGGLNIFASFGCTISIIISLCRYSHRAFQNAQYDNSTTLALVILSVLLFLSVVWISFSILLMVGIYQDRYRLMTFWIYFQYVSMVFVILIAIVDVSKQFLKKMPFSDVCLEFVAVCVITGVIALCLFPVFKLYKSMRWPSHQPEHRIWIRNDLPTNSIIEVSDQN